MGSSETDLSLGFYQNESHGGRTEFDDIGAAITNSESDVALNPEQRGSRRKQGNRSEEFEEPEEPEKPEEPEMFEETEEIGKIQ